MDPLNVPLPLSVNVHAVAPVGGVHLTCTDPPATALCGTGVTVTAGHTVTYVEAEYGVGADPGGTCWQVSVYLYVVPGVANGPTGEGELG